MRRRLRRFAARITSAARSSAGTQRHDSKAVRAAATAASTSRAPAWWTTATTLPACEGSSVRNVSPVLTARPPISSGNSRPRAAPTVRSASSMAWRPGPVAKSASGSLRNSGGVITARASRQRGERAGDPVDALLDPRQRGGVREAEKARPLEGLARDNRDMRLLEQGLAQRDGGGGPAGPAQEPAHVRKR